jgi:hypothetical protein
VCLQRTSERESIAFIPVAFFWFCIAGLLVNYIDNQLESHDFYVLDCILHT